MKPVIAALGARDETGDPADGDPDGTRPDAGLVRLARSGDAHPHGNLTGAGGDPEVEQRRRRPSWRCSFSPREMHELYAALGFGTRPQLGFPGAVGGRLRPWKTWKPIEQATMSYGYGLSAFAVPDRPCLLGVRPGRRADPVTSRSTLQRGRARRGRRHPHLLAGHGARSPTHHAADGRGGRGARLPRRRRWVGRSAARGGTAHKHEGDGYAAKKYRSWFVGMAPTRNPRIVVAVMIDEPS